MEFLQRLIVSAGTAKVYPLDFPHAIHQALALPLAKPGISRADIIRSVNTLAAAGAEAMVIVRLMNLRQEQLLALMCGMPEAIPTMEVNIEDFNFNGSLDGEL